MTVTPKKNEKETNREYALRVLEEKYNLFGTCTGG